MNKTRREDENILINNTNVLCYIITNVNKIINYFSGKFNVS